MSERASPPGEPEADGRAAHHYGQAAEHARRAADLLEKARARVLRDERASAVEMGKGACGHLGESYSHVAEAQRIGAASEEGPSDSDSEEEQGSHWNDADPGDSAQQP